MGQERERNQDRRMKRLREVLLCMSMTLSDGSTQKEYTADEVKKLGTEKNTYSGRNKKVQNARFFEEYEGVDLRTLLKDAGFKTDGASMKVVCDYDTYTNDSQAYNVQGWGSYIQNIEVSYK